MSIAHIRQVIAPEWDTFVLFYRQQMHSDTPEINLVLDYIQSQPSKQLRPLLTLLSAALHGGITMHSHVGASMVELIHVGTLLHDDVIDEASERRGSISVNARWQPKVAILTGDFLFARAFLSAIEHNAYDMMQILGSTAQGIGEGEMIQLQKTQDLDTDEPLYLEIIRKKTASLLQACMHIGAISAGAAQERIAVAKEFGLLLGIAFQIRDDMLDYHSEKQTGKVSGNDIVERKLTLPLIFALRQSDRRQRNRILDMVAGARQNPDNVARVMDFVRNNGGLEYTEAKMLQYAAQAKDLLANYPSSNIKDALLRLTEYVTTRSK